MRFNNSYVSYVILLTVILSTLFFEDELKTEPTSSNQLIQQKHNKQEIKISEAETIPAPTLLVSEEINYAQIRAGIFADESQLDIHPDLLSSTHFDLIASLDKYDPEINYEALSSEIVDLWLYSYSNLSEEQFAAINNLLEDPSLYSTRTYAFSNDYYPSGSTTLIYPKGNNSNFYIEYNEQTDNYIVQIPYGKLFSNPTEQTFDQDKSLNALKNALFKMDKSNAAINIQKLINPSEDNVRCINNKCLLNIIPKDPEALSVKIQSLYPRCRLIAPRFPNKKTPSFADLVCDKGEIMGDFME